MIDADLVQIIHKFHSRFLFEQSAQIASVQIKKRSNKILGQIFLVIMLDIHLDLRECLSAEQLEKLKAKLLTASDGRVIGIYADNLPVMKQNRCYENTNTRAAIGIIYNTPHRDEAVKYLLYTAGMRE